MRIIILQTKSQCCYQEKTNSILTILRLERIQKVSIAIVHVMDTGVPAIRSEDKPDNTSFNKTSHSSIHFFMYNE